MEDDATPTAETLEMEERQIRRCRWAFLLFAANLVFQVALAFFTVSLWTSDGVAADERIVPRTPTLVEYLLVIASLLTTLTPAALLLWLQARSPRWQRTSLGLVGIVVLELVVIGLQMVWRPKGEPISTPEPLRVRLLLHAQELATWVELWCMAVLVAEFGSACRATRLIERTESLSYLLLFGFGSGLMLVAWMLPSSQSLTDPDGVTMTLGLVHQLAMLGALYWTFLILASASSLARILAQRSRELRQQTESDSPT